MIRGHSSVSASAAFHLRQAWAARRPGPTTLSAAAYHHWGTACSELSRGIDQAWPGAIWRRRGTCSCRGRGSARSAPVAITATTGPSLPRPLTGHLSATALKYLTHREYRLTRATACWEAAPLLSSPLPPESRILIWRTAVLARLHIQIPAWAAAPLPGGIWGPTARTSTTLCIT